MLLNDPAIFGLIGSVRLFQRGSSSVSIRPAAFIPTFAKDPYLFHSQVQARVPVTLDFFQRSRVSVFLGGGAAPNFDSSGRTAWMYSWGGDLRVTRRVSLRGTANWVLRPWLSDNKDREAIGNVAIRF
jgi:hypothetical protein